MEKKKYIEPTIEIIQVEDIITASGKLPQVPWNPDSQDDPFDVDIFK